MKSVLRAVTLIALAGALTACGGSEQPVSAPAPTTAAASTPPAPTKAAIEQAYVLELAASVPEGLLARAELIEAGYASCKAFRDKPGDMTTLVENMKKDGQTEERIAQTKAIATAAIHNLCTDQAGDL